MICLLFLCIQDDYFLDMFHFRPQKAKQTSKQEIVCLFSAIHKLQVTVNSLCNKGLNTYIS